MHYFKLPIIASISCLTISCGSGPAYQEPDYEIKELPKPAPVVDVAQPDFEIPGVAVNRNDTPLTDPNRGLREGEVTPATNARLLVTAIPLARRVPGRPGCVFNPYNQNIVDVDGIPSGTKVLDPLDNDKTHIFKVP